MLFFIPSAAPSTFALLVGLERLPSAPWDVEREALPR
jgi:hypothetical protein